MQESWWLLVVALFAYLALILATYQRSDAAWSFTGNGGTTLNKGGVVGAWLSDLLLYLFGISAWWWVFAGAVVVVSGYRRLSSRGRADGEAERRHHRWLAIPGFVALLLSSAALEALRLYHLPATLPHGPGGAIGELLSEGLARALGFNGATLLLIVVFAVGWSLLTGMSWLRLMERIGAGIELTLGLTRSWREKRHDRLLGAAALEQREQAVEAARDIDEEREPVVVVPPVFELPKSERVVKERQKPLFKDLPDSPLPPLALLEDAPHAHELVSA